MDAVQAPFSPAAERNKQAILAVLQTRLPETGLILEIGAGTGQHALHIAAVLHSIEWLPTERPERLATLCAGIGIKQRSNIHPPVALDVEWAEWPVESAAAVFAANVAHIMSWQAVVSMLTGVSRVLPDEGCFYLYGPFHRDGQPTSPGNARFDAALRAADNPDGSHQGIRDDREMIAAAHAAGIHLSADIDMPANNRILVLTVSKSE